MKKIGILVTVLFTSVCFAQKNTNLLFSYLEKPVDVNACYQPTPAIILHTKTEQVLFKTTDNGTTWVDCSKGLPKGVEISRILPKEDGMYVGTTDGKMYYTANLASGNWELQTLEIKAGAPHHFFTGIFSLPSGTYASVYGSGLYKLTPGTQVWNALPGELENATIFSLHQTANASLLATTSLGIYQSVNQGKTWEPLYTKGWVNNLVIQNNTWVANCADGLIRSTDEGKHWTTALAEVAANFKLNIIDGYLVAIRSTAPGNGAYQPLPYATISTDEGVSWKNMDAGKPADTQVFDLQKMDHYLFSSRKAGISRSNDLGKTWQLLLTPPHELDPWQFDMVVTNTAMFAVLKWGGC